MQLSARDAMQAAAVTWSGISDARRAGWNAYALTTDYLNGRSAFIAGYSLTYFLIDWFGAAITLTADPPDVPGPLIIDGFKRVTTFGAGGDEGVRCTIDNLNNEPIMLYIQGVHNISPARNFHAGPWDSSMSKTRQFNALEHRTITQYGDAGLTVFIRVRAVSQHGPKRVSQFFRYRDIAIVWDPA